MRRRETLSTLFLIAVFCASLTGQVQGVRDFDPVLNPDGRDRCSEDAQKPFFLAKPNEPGERLKISIRILENGSGRRVPGASISLFQTDVTGNYRSRFFGIPSFARIRGKAVADQSGCLIVDTILPGDYPGAKENRHIHFSVKAKGFKKFKNEFLFEGFVNDAMRKIAVDTGSGTILKIHKDANGSWEAQVDLGLKPR